LSNNFFLNCLFKTACFFFRFRRKGHTCIWKEFANQRKNHINKWPVFRNYARRRTFLCIPEPWWYKK
jgi:hypothetical protein